MPVTSTFEIVATEIKELIEAEFAPEQFTAIFDNIHESLGEKRVDIGIFPVEMAQRSANNIVRDTVIQVKFYDLWRKEISPHTVVNPVKIATYAERFARAVERNNNQRLGNSVMWFFELTRIEFPDDPTGNKSRFVATIRAVGNNSGLVETTG